MMDTIENNKLIAKFMNLGYQQGMAEHPVTGEYTYPEFDYSWDWLMPVVQKIWAIERSNHKKLSNRIFNLLDKPIYTEIEEVYSDVVSFIKQYNTISVT